MRIEKYFYICMLLVSGLFFSCRSAEKNNVKTIGFLDFVEDATLAKARQGFTDALEKNAFSEKNNTIKIIYRNAQGDIPVLGQACDYFVSEKVEMIACNTTLATVTAVQRTKEIPVCMMVAPRPDLAGLTDAAGKSPANLFGVYETLDYIDTAVQIIKEVLPEAKKVCAIYNQSEQQSVAAFERINKKCNAIGMSLHALPVNNSSETQLVVASLLKEKPDVFFALPDNTVFASFETIVKSCNEAGVPVITSEAGLVQRGALSAYGADMYQWGYQSGLQAAAFLQSKKMPSAELVKTRKRVYNPETAKRFAIHFNSSFEILK